jgi:hypothetical protein
MAKNKQGTEKGFHGGNLYGRHLYLTQAVISSLIYK